MLVARIFRRSAHKKNVARNNAQQMESLKARVAEVTALVEGIRANYNGSESLMPQPIRADLRRINALLGQCNEFIATCESPENRNSVGHSRHQGATCAKFEKRITDSMAKLSATCLSCASQQLSGGRMQAGPPAHAAVTPGGAQQTSLNDVKLPFADAPPGYDESQAMQRYGSVRR
eukprot:Opistho-2@79742